MHRAVSVAYVLVERRLVSAGALAVVGTLSGASHFLPDRGVVIVSADAARQWLHHQWISTVCRRLGQLQHLRRGSVLHRLQSEGLHECSRDARLLAGHRQEWQARLCPRLRRGQYQFTQACITGQPVSHLYF